MIHGAVPFWLKVVYAAYLCVLIPLYAIQYPLANFLWFSDIALVAASRLWPQVFSHRWGTD